MAKAMVDNILCSDLYIKETNSSSSRVILESDKSQCVKDDTLRSKASLIHF